MRINKDKCNQCKLCIDACPVGAVCHGNGEIYISEELCANTLQCTAMQACPNDAVERTMRRQDTVMCTICPVGCQIGNGKTGECRMYTNKNGSIVRLVPLTSCEDSRIAVTEEYDDEIKRPLVTAIGAGFRASTTPLIVQDKVRGIDVVTCVSECHFEYSGILVKIDCDEYVGEEEAKVYYKGKKVGRVTHELYGGKTLYIGSVNDIISKDGWVAAKVCATLANREKVKLNIENGAHLEIQVGEKPKVNSNESDIRRLVCGNTAAVYLYNDFLAGLVDEVIVIDRHICGQFGIFEKEETRYGRLTNEEEQKTRWGRLTRSGIRLRGASPIGMHKFPEPGGTGWGMTQFQSPLDIIESIDIGRINPGFRLLITEPNAARIAYFVFSEDKRFEEAEIPMPISKAMKEYKMCCEPASVSAYFMPCASGSARHKFVSPRQTRNLQKAIYDKKVRITIGGAPTWLLKGGGVAVMVDVEHVKAGSFHWTNHPAVVAPLEWTMKLDDFIKIGGITNYIRPLKEVIKKQDTVT